MDKLTAMDAGFLYAETSKCNSNVASVQVLTLPTGVSSRQWIDSYKSYVAERSHQLPFMNRKPVFTPGNLDHPVWEQVDEIDVETHIEEYPVPAPGAREDMEQAIAAVQAIRMPLDRPLWKLYILSGLEGNRVAHCMQIHHATIDGASGNHALQVLMDETPEHPPVAAPEPSAAAEPKGMLDLFGDSIRNFARFQMEAAERMQGAADTSRRLINRAIDPSKNFGAYSKVAPKTPFNKAISDKRSWSCGEFPLADVKQMGKSVGATINDVFMAICAGALRNYLDREGNLPESSLIAACPVSLRKPGDTSNSTQVTSMSVELATEIEDDVERLMAISASSETAKEMVADLAGIYDNNQSIPGLPLMMSGGIAASELMGLANIARSPANVCISNVPGPRETLYANGAEMTTHYPVSIATHGMGLNITVQSYRDQMYFGITGCAEALPDAAQLRNDMLSAFVALRGRLLPSSTYELNARQHNVNRTADSEAAETSEESREAA